MAGIFETASLTSSGRPVLHPTEVECHLLSSVDLEPEPEPEPDSPSFPYLKSGILILTTHRLIWIPNFATSTPSSATSTPNFATSTPLSIHLSTVSHIFSSKKKTLISFHSPRIRFQVRNAVVVTVVARGKGTDFDGFVAKFWECWRGRAWDRDGGASDGRNDGGGGRVGSGSGGGDGFYSSDGSVRMVGVSGILRKEQESWESTDKSLHDAFQDLNALMSKAKEMVMLAEKMRQKLLSGSSSQNSEANDDEIGSKEDMQDWLLSVGIISPVTKESAGALYHQELSRQLADFVRIPLERAGGMINLIDIYCLFNRARGTALISPEDLLQACSLWVKFDVPVMLRKFDSGVMVVQNKSHSDEEVFVRIRSLVTKSDALKDGISASDAAMTLGIAPAMAKEHLLNAESRGLICRDISPEGIRFYVNIFPDIDMDDVYLVKEHKIYSSWARVFSQEQSAYRS